MFHFIARTFQDLSPFQISVAVDGSVELTGLLGDTMLTVEVSPGSGRMDAVMDTLSGVVWVGHDISTEDLMKEIQRAA